MGLTPLELKPITIEQLPAVVELDQLCFNGLWTQEAYQREIESPNSDLIGLAIPEAVHPHYRGQGFGRALLFGLLKSARARGMQRATLEVRESNQAALSLYQKFGFQTAGRRRRYYQDNNEDALILWRSGLGHPQFEETLASWYGEISSRLVSFGWNLSH